MEVDKIVVTLFSLGMILLTYWFFLMKKDEEVSAVDNSIDITVEGGYKPASVVIPLGKTTKINFKRLDPSSCLEEVVLSEFKIKKYLPLNETVSIEVTPKKKGESDFSCGMNMFHGKLIVK